MRKKIAITAIILMALLAVAVGIGAYAASEPEISVEYGRLSYKDGVVTMDYAVEFKKVGSDAERGLLIWKSDSDGNYVKGREDILLSSDKFVVIDGVVYNKFSLDGIAERELTDDIYAVAYAKIGTTIYYSNVVKYSPLRYVYTVEGRIGSYSAPDGRVPEFLSQMVENGAAAQIRDSYKIDRLATEAFVEVKLTGGSFADGTNEIFAVAGSQVAVFPDEPSDKVIAGWQDSSGVSVAADSLEYITVPDKNCTVEAVFAAAGNSIEYDLCAADARFVSEPPTEYKPGEDVLFPIPVREGYDFGGWYTDPTYDVNTATRGVTAYQKGDVKVFASWSRKLWGEDYSTLSGLSIGGSIKEQYTTGNNTTFRANNADGSTFVSDGKGVVWSTGAKGSDILVSPTGGLAGLMGGDNIVTVTASVSLVEGKNPPPSTLRLRVAYKTEVLPIMNIQADGSVYLGADKECKITTLTNELQSLTLVLDFESAQIFAVCEEGYIVASRELSVPEGSKFTNLVDWKNDITRHALNWVCSGRSSENAMRIGEISIYSGNYGLKSSTRQLFTDELTKMLVQIRAKNSAFKKSDFLSPYSTMTLASSTSMPAPVYNVAPKLSGRVGGTGARLMLNDSMIEGILAAFEDEKCADAYAELIALADSDTDGRLGEPSINYNGRLGLHNFDTKVLAAIEAKALMFRVLYEQDLEEGSYGAYLRDVYGYGAILGIKNFLETMQIHYISSDQCREFGYAMFVAAEVYDWCYPILNTADKAQIRFAVVTRCCEGTSVSTDSSLVTYKGVKMEVGFPPQGQSSVADHGAEAQVLRDYLSFALAIYDEDPTWWNYVAGRVMGDYVPVRNYYFQSGITQQGVSLYAHHRHYSDLYSAWILQTATGKNPYVGMENTVKSIISSLNPTEEAFFSSGDGAIETPRRDRLPNNALIAAAIYDDDMLFTWSYDTKGSLNYGYGTTTVTPANLIIFASQGMELVEDKYEGLSPIMYNGFPLGQMVTRYKWDDPDAAATYMKLGIKTTAGHEHQDAGTFQIYYKGLLTSDSGLYNNSGHEQTAYYQRATIAHNGILVFNPAKWDFNSTDPETKWYSGGQRRVSAPKNLNILQREKYDTGVLMGAQYGFKDEAGKISDYAYLAGDITKAYDADTVAFMSRSMLTVYNDATDECPMYFFVFDSVESTSASFKKTFLLHIRGYNEPTVEGNVITTVNGDGKLVVHSLTDGATIEKVGGVVFDEKGKYNPEASRNFLINGHQIIALNRGSDGNWGRIEVIKSGEKKTTFMHAMYVTDRDSTASPEVTKIAAEGIEGAVIGNVAAVFRDSAERTSQKVGFTVSGEGELRYFVAGLAQGEWSLAVNGEKLGTVSAGEGGMAVFEAPAGEVLLKPVVN